MNRSQIMIALGGWPVGTGPIDDVTRDDPALACAVAALDAVEARYGYLAIVIRRMSAFWKPGPRGFDIAHTFVRPRPSDVDRINHLLISATDEKVRTFDEMAAGWQELVEAHRRFNVAVGAAEPIVDDD